MKIKPIHSSFGLEISEVDCARASDADLADILRYLFHYKLLVIRRQNLSPRQYEYFMAQLGQPVPHMLEQYCLPHHRNILIISNLHDESGKPVGVLEGGAYWHTDMSYLQDNTVATSLYAVHAQRGKGQTRFLDCAQGYALLQSACDIQQFLFAQLCNDLEQIRVIHRFGNRRYDYGMDTAHQPLSETQRASLQEVEYSLAIRHPITGEVSLYAVAGTAWQLCGFSDQESFDALNEIEEFLFQHAPKYEHLYEVGDLVIWDNLSTLHSGVKLEATSSIDNCRLLYRMNINYMRRKI